MHPLGRHGRAAARGRGDELGNGDRGVAGQGDVDDRPRRSRRVVGIVSEACGGALRGRAMAGVNGNANARIFCNKIEAELLAIDGFYQTAEDIDLSLRGRPAQAWLEGNAMKITALS